MAIKLLQTTTEKQVNTNANQKINYDKEYEVQRAKYKKTKKDMKDDIMHLNLFVSENKELQTRKATIMQQIADLEIQLKQDKREGMIRINDAEFEKIKDVKRLTEEMDFKVKETQANLMALNDEQLQTQTRLTILQNHQLTTELDYQSKNTEQLVQTHDKMTKQIEVLKRKISLHK